MFNRYIVCFKMVSISHVRLQLTFFFFFLIDQQIFLSNRLIVWLIECHKKEENVHYADHKGCKNLKVLFCEKCYLKTEDEKRKIWYKDITFVFSNFVKELIWQPQHTEWAVDLKLNSL